MEDGAEVGVMLHSPRRSGAMGSWKGNRGFFLRAFGGSMVLGVP